MNSKHYLAAIFAFAILSIAFLSCNPDDEEPPTTPATIDVVKEVYGFYGKHEAEVLTALDKKGFTKSLVEIENGIIHSYTSLDSCKTYSVVSEDSVIVSSFYKENNRSGNIKNNLLKTENQFLSNFEKWEESLSKIITTYPTYLGYIYIKEGNTGDFYHERDVFLTEYQAKKSVLNQASSSFYGSEINGSVAVGIDFESLGSYVTVSFNSNNIYDKNCKN
ncbi:MAG: hypothetical protein PHX48_00775 [Bacteroidales bacterium]|nr:hypothetical protein [Bacteroidales bacterium]